MRVARQVGITACSPAGPLLLLCASDALPIHTA